MITLNRKQASLCLPQMQIINDILEKDLCYPQRRLSIYLLTNFLACCKGSDVLTVGYSGWGRSESTALLASDKVSSAESCKYIAPEIKHHIGLQEADIASLTAG